MLAIFRSRRKFLCPTCDFALHAKGCAIRAMQSWIESASNFTTNLPMSRLEKLGATCRSKVALLSITKASITFLRRQG